MQGLSLWPERQARVVRWCLLIGWGLLILSLLIPALQLPEALAPQCDPEAAACAAPRTRQSSLLGSRCSLIGVDAGGVEP